jgi:hypothetical protein
MKRDEFVGWLMPEAQRSGCLVVVAARDYPSPRGESWSVGYVCVVVQQNLSGNQPAQEITGVYKSSRLRI